MSKKVCAFTGHRPQSLPFGSNEQDERCQKLKAVLEQEIERVYSEKGVTHFISGMALGVDTFAAEAVLHLKEKYPEITLECAIPCETQAVKWNEQQRDRYFGIVERCDKETMLQTHYTPDCIQSFSQLDKNYGKEGSEIIVDNTQITLFGGFAPNSNSAETLSKALGSRTVMSGSVSRSKNDPSQSLQMVERPLMTPDELKSLPKGDFIVMKTGVHPISPFSENTGKIAKR